MSCKFADSIYELIGIHALWSNQRLNFSAFSCSWDETLISYLFVSSVLAAVDYLAFFILNKRWHFHSAANINEGSRNLWEELQNVRKSHYRRMATASNIVWQVPMTARSH